MQPWAEGETSFFSHSARTYGGFEYTIKQGNDLTLLLHSDPHLLWNRGHVLLFLF